MRSWAFLTAWLWAGAAWATPALSLDLLLPQPVNIPPGGTVTVSGAVRSSYDGSIIDALSTRAEGRVEGKVEDGRAQAGGLLDFEAGGLRLVSQKPEAHEYRFAATAQPGRGCLTARLPSPCLIPRLLPLAQSRLLTVADLSDSLSGGLSLEGTSSPASAPLCWSARGSLALLLGAGLAALAARRRRNRARSLYGQADRLIRSLRRRLRRGDPVHQRLTEPLANLDADAKRLEHERRRGLAEGWPGEAARAEVALMNIVDTVQTLHTTLDAATRMDRAHIDPERLRALERGLAAATSAVQDLGAG